MAVPVRHSKSEADKVILLAVHHRATDIFMASRLAVRAVDYNERKSERTDKIHAAASEMTTWVYKLLKTEVLLEEQLPFSNGEEILQS